MSLQIKLADQILAEDSHKPLFEVGDATSHHFDHPALE